MNFIFLNLVLLSGIIANANAANDFTEKEFLYFTQVIYANRFDLVEKRNKEQTGAYAEITLKEFQELSDLFRSVDTQDKNNWSLIGPVDTQIFKKSSSWTSKFFYTKDMNPTQSKYKKTFMVYFTAELKCATKYGYTDTSTIQTTGGYFEVVGYNCFILNYSWIDNEEYRIVKSRAGKDKFVRIARW